MLKEYVSSIFKDRGFKMKNSLLILCTLIIASMLNAEVKTQFYKDGSVKETSNIVNGNKEGITKGYFQNGKLDFLSTFKNDEFHGLSELYYENGQLLERMYFINGKRDGEYLTYYKDGKLKSKIHFKHGVRAGIHIEYNHKGEIVKELLFGEPKVDGFSLDIKQGKAHERTHYEESFIVDKLKPQVDILSVMGKNLLFRNETEVKYTVNLNIESPTQEELETIIVKIDTRDTQNKHTVVEVKLDSSLVVTYQLEKEHTIKEIKIDVYLKNEKNNRAGMLTEIRPLRKGEIANSGFFRVD